MSIIFRLYQEGNVRLLGFQTTEWIDLNSSYTTLPLADVFVLRKNAYGKPDTFERVATPEDYGTLGTNALIYFDAKGPFIVDGLNPIAGDILRLKATNFEHWATANPINGISYTITPDGYMEFPVLAYESFKGKQTGDAPPVLAGNTISVSNYFFTEEDVGRRIILTGFTNPSNNVFPVIQSVSGGLAKTSTIFINESGTTSASWSFARIKLVATKPIPRIEANVEWQVFRTGTGTIFSGTTGTPMRRYFDTVLFRDNRLTMLNATQDIAQNHFDLVQSFLTSLQRKLAKVDTAFFSVGPYDFGP